MVLDSKLLFMRVFSIVGPGVFAELVSRWVAHYALPPGFLSQCSASSHVLSLSRESSRVEQPDQPETQGEDSPAKDTSVESVQGT